MVSFEVTRRNDYPDVSDRQFAVIRDGFHDDVGGDGIEVDFFDQVPVDPIEILHVTGDDFQQIIVFSGDAVEICDVRDGEDEVAKTGEPVVVMMAGPDHDKGSEAKTEIGWIEAEGVLAEETTFLQGIEAFPAGVLRQADSISESALREGGIALQGTEYCAINMIDISHNERSYDTNITL